MNILRWLVIALVSGVAIGLYMEQKRQRKIYEAQQARLQRGNDEIWASFTAEQKAGFIIWEKLMEEEGYDEES